MFAVPAEGTYNHPQTLLLDLSSAGKGRQPREGRREEEGKRGVGKGAVGLAHCKNF